MHSDTNSSDKISQLESTLEQLQNDVPKYQAPDGGSAAWIAVFCSHLITLNTWGFINSFGVFQSTYADLFAPISPSSISWIGSTQVFLLFFIGTPAGWLSDIGYFRHLLGLGSILQVAGLFLAAQATEYWQVLLAQGICMGLGNGLIFCPSLAVVSTYFQKRKSIAIGIAMTGSSTGGLIFPSMVRQLLPQVGLPWTLRAIGFLQLGMLLLVNLLMKPRLPPSKGNRLTDWSAFHDPVYSLYAASMFFNFLGLYFAFYYISSFAKSPILGHAFTNDKSLDLLLILNGVGLVGRIVPNILADQKTGQINVLLPMALSCGLLCLCWPAVRSEAGMYVWTSVYAITAAAVQSMSPAALSSLTEDFRVAGIRMGMALSILSFSVLIGPPIAGTIINRQNGEYWGAQIFAGASFVAGSGLLAAARSVKLRQRKQSIWSRV